MLNYKAPLALFENKSILVTGASQGIGQQVAYAYAEHGARVILHGRQTAELEKLANRITAAGYLAPQILTQDLQSTKIADYQALAAAIAAEHCCLDGVLLNAGLLGAITSLMETSLTVWQQVQQVNVTANLLLLQALAPLLLASAEASVIFTSSGVGRQGRAGWGSYAVSKFATEGLMQVLADEWSTTTIRVNAINPGATRTGMRASARPEEDPLTLPTPADLMPLYLWLMGHDARHIRGQSLDAQPKVSTPARHCPEIYTCQAMTAALTRK